MTMNETQSALWTELASFDINDGNENFTFEMRLARENRWTHEFTARVMEEYRRFLFLCSVAGHPCSPSDQVDQAWHLHLTYTRSYWERLCRDVLPNPLHHEPTKGGTSESRKFDDWYDRTLESYRNLFGSEPPLDIWPPTHLRFVPLRPEPSPADIWIVSKTRAKRVFAFMGSLTAATVATFGCEKREETGVAIMAMTVVLAILIAAGIAAASSLQDPDARRRRRHASLGGDASDGSDGWFWSGGGEGGGGDHGHGSHGCGGHGHGCGGHGCGGHGCGSGCGGGCGGGH